MAINTTDDTLMGATYIPGRFIPYSICFGGITQQETYYIILVSVRASASTDSMNSILQLVYMYHDNSHEASESDLVLIFMLFFR